MSNNNQNRESLKAAIWQVVNDICNEEADELSVIPTQQFIASLTDLVYKQAETFAINLENFANHANRSTVLIDDVKLCSRRNDELVSVLAISSSWQGFYTESLILLLIEQIIEFLKNTHIGEFANSIAEQRVTRPSKRKLRHQHDENHD